MEANISVVFYRTVSEKSLYSAILYLYRTVERRYCIYEHCAVRINFKGTKEDIMYHVGTNMKSRWIKFKVLKNFEPAVTVDLGSKDVDILTIKSIGPIKFQLWVYLWWYLITRWFSKWQPKNNCAIKSSEILIKLGYDVTPTCVPIRLCNELQKGVKHADNINSG